MSNILQSMILVVSVFSLGLELSAVAENETELQSARIVHFPKERSIGKYAIFCTGRDVDAIKESALQKARGDVEVPANMQLFLMFMDATLKSNNSPIDLSPLDQLRPTDIQALSVQPFVRVSAEELKRLRRHVSLRVVVLNGLNKIDDCCMASLSDLKTLEVLQIPEAIITDKGLAYLERLVNLQVLNLYGTKVTDSGLKYLRRMSKLKSLDLRNTRVTDEGVKEIRQALPQCIVKK
jgi:hypothetical protein